VRTGLGSSSLSEAVSALMPRCQSRKSDILCTHVRTRLQRDARKFLQTQNASRLMRLELSCARFILVEVSLHEKNSSGSSGGFGALRRTTGSCRGRLWNPVAIPIPCLDSFRPLRPRKPWQLRPAGSGSTPARIPFQIGLPSSTKPETRNSSFANF